MAREFLDDAFGPDGVRVTIAVEQAVDRLLRARDRWTVPRAFDPLARAARRLLPDLIQDGVLHDQWAVEVEADSGERARATRPTRAEAYALGRAFRQRVVADGTAAIAQLR